MLLLLLVSNIAKWPRTQKRSAYEGLGPQLRIRKKNVLTYLVLFLKIGKVSVTTILRSFCFKASKDLLTLILLSYRMVINYLNKNEI